MPLKLNKEQLAAAEFLDGTCVVVAVPGSGKTLTMTHQDWQSGQKRRGAGKYSWIDVYTQCS